MGLSDWRDEVWGRWERRPYLSDLYQDQWEKGRDRFGEFPLAARIAVGGGGAAGLIGLALVGFLVVRSNPDAPQTTTTSTEVTTTVTSLPLELPEPPESPVLSLIHI